MCTSVVCMSWQFLPIDPIRYAEVEMRPVGEVYDIQAIWLLLVLGLHEDDERGVPAVRCEASNFAHRVLVRFEVCGAAHVFGVREEGGEDFGVGVERGVEGGGD